MTLEHINMRFQKGGFFSKDRSVHVLKDIDLTIGEGEILALVGESGCGKTTLGKIITGLYVPTEGQIALQGESGESALLFAGAVYSAGFLCGTQSGKDHLSKPLCAYPHA